MTKRFIFGTLSIFTVLTFCFFTHKDALSASARFKNEFLYRINSIRAQGCNCGNTYMPPVPPLTWNNTLEAAAEGHAEDMNYKNYFSHYSKDGRNMEDRIVLAGYIFKGYKSFAVGENIAFGQQSIAEVMDGWLNSPGHCHNLMNAEFKEVGVARAGTYWVQDFGGRESFNQQQQKMLKDGKLILKRYRASE